jgi:hypothetical protein
VLNSTTVKYVILGITVHKGMEKVSSVTGM